MSTPYHKPLRTVSILALACAITVGAAIGQEAEENNRIASADAQQDAESVLDRVTVTGSLISRSGFQAPSPVTVIEADQLAKSSPSTLAAALNNLPALVSEGGPNATSGQRTAGRNYLNLRGIGSERTLTLVNGRRFPGSAPGGTVDTNLIPQGLVERVEVVTGGASAAYGSDAVAGVVNFILDTRFEGFKISGSAGLSQEGDGFEYRGSATYGRAFGDDLNFVISGEYYNAEGVDGDARDHRVQGANLIPNPNADGTAANPGLIIADMARSSDSTYGGYIASFGRGSPRSSTLLGAQFLSGGTVAPFDGGLNGTRTLQDGGDGVNTSILQPITRPLERATVYAGLDYDLSSNIRLFVNGGLGWSESSNETSAFHTGRFGVTIRPDNAFLPAAVRQQMVDEGITSFLLNRYDTEYLMEVIAENENQRIEAGFEWGLGDFVLQVSGQIGSNSEVARNYKNYIPELYALGADAVFDTNGAVVCRDPSNGCVPINPFGVGSYTPEMIDYFTGTSLLETNVDQELLRLVLTGKLFDGIGAGQWDVAVGGEYRKDDVEVVVDERSENNEYFTNNFRGWAADREVKEIFAEINMPLISDQPGVELLELNVAGRHTNYTFSGGVDTWKAGLNYRPFSDLRVRGTVSRDIRAPSPAEMFTLGRQTNRNTYFDPVQNGTVTPLTAVRGNPFLLPEIADTYVIGLVYEPSWLPGLSVSLDRFDIQMQDALNTLSGQEIIDQCHIEGFQQACLQIVRDANNDIIQINNSNFNLDKLELVGWDLETRYTTDIGPGDLTLRAQVGYMERLREQDFENNTIDRVGETTTPEWRALTSATYRKGSWDFFLQARYIGENMLNVRWTPVDSEYNDVPAEIYLDGQIGYDLNEGTSFFLNVQNLLNEEPLFAPQQDTYFSPTNPNVYDQIGRTFRVGFRSTF